MPTTLHITNSWHEKSGGVKTYYRALADYAVAQNRSMRLIVPGRESRTVRLSRSVVIYEVEARHAALGDPGYRVMWPWGSTGRRIREILRREQPDLVEISDKWALPIVAGCLYAGWVAGVRRPVLIGTSHERLDDCIEVYLGLGIFGQWLSRTMLRRYYWRMFDHHVANSVYTAAELRLAAERGHRVHRDLHILPMGVDTTGLDPARRTQQARLELATRLGVAPTSRILVYAGRLAYEKNIPLLIDTLECLPPEYQLVLAGDGPVRGWLLSPPVAARTADRCHLLGHLAGREELAQVLAGADAFVHPNSREPFGIAPLEAMAAGIPVVVPAAGGVLSYAHNGNAWMASPDARSFSVAIQSACTDSEAKSRRCEQARETAAEFSWPKVAARYFGLWDEILHRAEPRPASSEGLLPAECHSTQQ